MEAARGVPDQMTLGAAGADGAETPNRVERAMEVNTAPTLTAADFAAYAPEWVTPLAKDFGMPSLNTLAEMSLDLTDATGSGADLVRVRVGKGACWAMPCTAPSRACPMSSASARWDWPARWSWRLQRARPASGLMT